MTELKYVLEEIKTDNKVIIASGTREHCQKVRKMLGNNPYMLIRPVCSRKYVGTKAYCINYLTKNQNHIRWKLSLHTMAERVVYKDDENTEIK